MERSGYGISRQKTTFWNSLGVHRLVSGKEKHININKFGGLSRDWVGGKNLFMCFLWVIPYGGEKTHKQNPPQNPVTIREMLVYMSCYLCVYSLPHCRHERIRGIQLVVIIDQMVCVMKSSWETPSGNRCGFQQDPWKAVMSCDSSWEMQASRTELVPGRPSLKCTEQCSWRGVGITDRGVTASKVLRGSQRFPERFQSFLKSDLLFEWSRKCWEVLRAVSPLSVTPLSLRRVRLMREKGSSRCGSIRWFYSSCCGFWICICFLAGPLLAPVLSLGDWVFNTPPVLALCCSSWQFCASTALYKNLVA